MRPTTSGTAFLVMRRTIPLPYVTEAAPGGVCETAHVGRRAWRPGGLFPRENRRYLSGAIQRFKVHGSRFKVRSGSRFRVRGSGFEVQGSRFKVRGLVIS